MLQEVDLTREFKGVQGLSSRDTAPKVWGVKGSLPKTAVLFKIAYAMGGAMFFGWVISHTRSLHKFPPEAQHLDITSRP